MWYRFMNKNTTTSMSRIKETRVPQPITIGKTSEMHAILLHGEHVKNLFTNLRPVPQLTL